MTPQAQQALRDLIVKVMEDNFQFGEIELADYAFIADEIVKQMALRANEPPGSIALRTERAHPLEWATAAVKARKMRDPKNREARKILRRETPWICGLCGKQIAESSGMNFDHKIPLSRGGVNRLSNLQLAHRSCNARKGNAWKP